MEDSPPAGSLGGICIDEFGREVWGDYIANPSGCTWFHKSQDTPERQQNHRQRLVEFEEQAKKLNRES